MSPRQLDVLGLAARGLTSAETARLLGVSEHTVKGHRKLAASALGARSTAHAVAIALAKGLIVP